MGIIEDDGQQNAWDALSLGEASFHTYSHQECLAPLRSHRPTPASRSKDGCAGCAEGRGAATAGLGARLWHGGTRLPAGTRQPRGQGAGSVRALRPRRLCVPGARGHGAGRSRCLRRHVRLSRGSGCGAGSEGWRCAARERRAGPGRAVPAPRGREGRGRRAGPDVSGRGGCSCGRRSPKRRRLRSCAHSALPQPPAPAAPGRSLAAQAARLLHSEREAEPAAPRAFPASARQQPDTD
ncbi:uncharacterized protein LOC135295134 [Passer domesticus]|uniref:uncharacterized protein LOC135295134 n=1 Tax=Passer domesticus TaxID=48849 RepID=UPI0030FEF1F3